MQQWLRWLKKDQQIVVIPSGGNSLINAAVGEQLDELRRITPNISAVIDSERSAPNTSLGADRQGFVDACELANVQIQVLERRATENYFTDTAIKAAVGDGYRALDVFEAFQGDLQWGKNNNWKIAREMKWEDISNTDLGKFLESL